MPPSTPSLCQCFLRWSYEVLLGGRFSTQVCWAWWMVVDATEDEHDPSFPDFFPACPLALLPDSDCSCLPPLLCHLSDLSLNEFSSLPWAFPVPVSHSQCSGTLLLLPPTISLWCSLDSASFTADAADHFLLLRISNPASLIFSSAQFLSMMICLALFTWCSSIRPRNGNGNFVPLL